MLLVRFVTNIEAYEDAVYPEVDFIPPVGLKVRATSGAIGLPDLTVVSCTLLKPDNARYPSIHALLDFGPEIGEIKRCQINEWK